MKFKVGDRVRIVKITHNTISSEYRKKYIGKIYTVESINPNGSYGDEHYGFEGTNYYIFYADELELAEFTKSDLKDGMVVEYRDGDRKMVLGNVFISFNGFSELENYDENLINKFYSGCNIDRIYISLARILDEYFDDKYLTLIWERPEEPTKKMTVAEIEKELGYKIEIVSND